MTRSKRFDIIVMDSELRSLWLATLFEVSLAAAVEEALRLSKLDELYLLPLFMVREA